jgi:hypothetical protein
MIRMLVVGYCYGIRSERRLCEEVHLNLAYRWFCRLGQEDVVPNHSTFSKNRHGRFRESNTFRWVFDKVMGACMAAGLVKGEGFAVDASIIEAEAGSRLVMPGDEPHVWQNPIRREKAYLYLTDQAKQNHKKLRLSQSQAATILLSESVRPTHRLSSPPAPAAFLPFFACPP